MKSYLLSFSFAVVALAASAQPKLSPEKYSVGDTAAYAVVSDSEPIAEGAAGANVTWDFTTLSQGTPYVQQIVSPSSTKYSTKFLNANTAAKGTDGTIVYMDISSWETRMLGLATAEGIVMSYAPAPLLMMRPVQYQDNQTSPLRYTYSYMGDNYMGSGTRSMEADAYGTLKLPGKTYTDVLRIRSEHISYDTGQFSGTVTYTSIVNYSWYSAEHTNAVLQIETRIVNNPFFQDTSRSVYYLVGETPASISKTPTIRKAYRSENDLVLEGDFSEKVSYQAIIANEFGQVVKKGLLQRTGNTLRLESEELSQKGTYFISVYGTDNTIYSTKLIQF